MDVRLAREVVKDRNEWREFVRGNAWAVGGGMNLMKTDLGEMTQLWVATGI